MENIKARDRAVLASNNILWMLNQMESIREQYEMTAIVSQNGSPTIKRLAKEQGEIISAIADRLDDIQQDLVKLAEEKNITLTTTHPADAG